MLGVLFFFASTFEHPGTRIGLGLELSGSIQKRHRIPVPMRIRSQVGVSVRRQVQRLQRTVNESF